MINQNHLFVLNTNSIKYMFRSRCLPRFYGVMVSTQDFESCDPSSNLGRTYFFLLLNEQSVLTYFRDTKNYTKLRQYNYC